MLADRSSLVRSLAGCLFVAPLLVRVPLMGFWFVYVDDTANGHGTYEEVHDEKEFFDLCKKSSRCIVHFGRPATRVRVHPPSARAGWPSSLG